MKKLVLALFALFMVLLSLDSVMAAKTFVEKVGPVKVNSVMAEDGYILVPYFVWGGDMVMFYANGGLKTVPDSIYGNLGLKIKLVPGDRIVEQARGVLSGKYAAFRATYRQAGIASEMFAADARTKLVDALQMTFSLGDHLVVRSEHIKIISDMKGKTFIMLEDPPQIGAMDDVLKTAKLTWNDIKVIWVKDITGPNGPAAKLRSTPEAHGAWVISPEMFGLTGDLQSIGTGAEGTLKGAKVLVSTNEMSKSIYDGVFFRQDFYNDNVDWVYKFVAGFMKATEEVLELRKEYESKGSKKYIALLQMAQDIYGKDVLPSLEVDAHGTLVDCDLVGYSGNVDFFEQEGNLVGFEAFQKSAQDLAVGQGYAKKRADILPSGLDYKSPYFVGYLKNTDVKVTKKFKAEAVEKEIAALEAAGLGDKRLEYFTVKYDAEQIDFPEEKYGEDFQRTIEWASKYSNAIILLRGHSDTALTIYNLVKAGIKKNILKVTGSKGNFKYFIDGKELVFDNMAEISRLIETGRFDGDSDFDPRLTLQAANALALDRAENCKKAIIAYAKKHKIVINESQFQISAAGIKEPIIPKPKNDMQAQENRRVEISIVRAQAESMSKTQFDEI